MDEGTELLETKTEAVQPLADGPHETDMPVASLQTAAEPIDSIALPVPQVDLPDGQGDARDTVIHDNPSLQAQSEVTESKVEDAQDTNTVRERAAEEFQPPRRPFSPSGRPLKCYIGNLSRECKMFHLREKFSPYGTITNVELKPNIGCGFVEFSTSDACAAACRSLDGTDLFDQVIRVEAQRERPDHKKNFSYGSDGCFNCGAKDHWSKHCPRGDSRPFSQAHRGRGRSDMRNSRRPYVPHTPYHDRRGPPVRASYGVAPPPSREQYIPQARPQYQVPAPRPTYPSHDVHPGDRYDSAPIARSGPGVYDREQRDTYAAQDPYGHDPYDAPKQYTVPPARTNYRNDRYADPYTSDPYALPMARDEYPSRDPPARNYGRDPYAAQTMRPRARSPGYDQEPPYPPVAPYGSSSNRARSRSPYDYNQNTHARDRYREPLRD